MSVCVCQCSCVYLNMFAEFQFWLQAISLHTIHFICQTFTFPLSLQLTTKSRRLLQVRTVAQNSELFVEDSTQLSPSMDGTLYCINYPLFDGQFQFCLSSIPRSPNSSSHSALCIHSQHVWLLPSPFRQHLEPNQPQIQSVPVIVSSVMWPGCAVNHSVWFSAEVKNEWSSTATPPTSFHGVERDFTFFSCSLVRDTASTLMKTGAGCSETALPDYTIKH